MLPLKSLAIILPFAMIDPANKSDVSSKRRKEQERRKEVRRGEGRLKAMMRRGGENGELYWVDIVE